MRVKETLDVLHVTVRSLFTFNEVVPLSGSELDKVTEETTQKTVHREVASVAHAFLASGLFRLRCSCNAFAMGSYSLFRKCSGVKLRKD